MVLFINVGLTHLCQFDGTFKTMCAGWTISGFIHSSVMLFGPKGRYLFSTYIYHSGEISVNCNNNNKKAQSDHLSKRNEQVSISE